MIGAGNMGSQRIVSASGNVKVGQGAVLGYLVGASSGGTLALYDDAATGTGTPLLAAMPLTAGQYVPVGLGFAQGLNAVVGGTATVTLVVA
jgi:hypothetical protein